MEKITNSCLPKDTNTRNSGVGEELYLNLNKICSTEKILYGRLPHISIDGEPNHENELTEGNIFNTFQEVVSQAIIKQLPHLKTNNILCFAQRKEYLLGTREKMYDNNPFLNANFWELTINDYRVAVFLSTRNPMNYAMIDFWINIELIENLCKKIKKETQKEQ